MKSNLIIFYSVIGFTFLSSHSHAQNKCNLILQLFEEKHMQDYINQFHPLMGIRITDLSGYFKKCIQGYDTHSIQTTSKLHIDQNTGRYIDITILKPIIRKKNIITINIVYAKNDISNDKLNLIGGTFSFELKDNNYTLIKTKVEYVE